MGQTGKENKAAGCEEGVRCSCCFPVSLILQLLGEMERIQ